MSWWDDGDDVLGDGPADRLTAAWRVVLGARARRKHAKPTLAEALEAFAFALRSADLKQVSRGIVLRKGDDEVAIFKGTPDAPDLTKAFSDAFVRIAQEYQQRFDRAPRSSELVKTLEFVIGYETESFLSDASAWPMQDLRLHAI